ncbi:MAG: hypothetical protein JNM55_06760 [Anaerolineales bacterium]|nr:hypothetical protein [Anaerolineales bacterium]
MKKSTDENLQFIVEKVSFVVFFEARLHWWGLTWTLPVGGVLYVTGFALLMNFLRALTPAEAIAQGYPAMPADWEAGVWDHGHFYQWYLPQNHPWLFVVSLIVGVGPVIYMFTMLWIVLKEWWYLEDR